MFAQKSIRYADEDGKVKRASIPITEREYWEQRFYHNVRGFCPVCNMPIYKGESIEHHVTNNHQK